MLGLISKLVPYGRLIKYGLLAAAVIGAGFYVWHLRSTVSSQHATISGLQGDLAKVSAIAQANAKAAQEAQAQAQRDQAALAAVSASQAITQRHLGSQLAKIHAAPKASADAPVPPLVWSTILGLPR